MKLVLHPRTTPLRVLAPCRAAGRPAVRPRTLCSQSSNFGESLSRKAREAQRKLEEWAQEQKVEEKLKQGAAAAGSKVQETVESVQDRVQRTAAEIDREYDVRGKAQQAAERAREVADEVESKYGLGRKVKNVYQDVRRKLPGWRRQLVDFYETPLGKVVAVALLFLALYTGLLFRLLNWLLLLTVFAPIILAPIISKQVEELRRAEQEEYLRQQQAQQRARDPLGDFFARNFQGGGGRGGGGGSSSGGRGQRAQGAAGRSRDGGQVIDVDWQTVDES